MERQIRIGITRLATARAQAAWLEECVQRATAEGATAPTRLEIVEVPIPGSPGVEAFMDMAARAAAELEALRGALVRGEVNLVLYHLGDHPDAIGLDEVAAVLGRPARGDVLLGPTCLDELPPGARVAVACNRTGVQLTQQRPDVHPVHLRGDSRTCVSKLDSGAIDALVLPESVAGWLGETMRVCQKLPLEHFIPGPGQGVLGLEVRSGDLEIKAWAQRLERPLTRLELAAEFACAGLLGLATVSGAHARARADALVLQAFVAGPEGEGFRRHEGSVTPPCTLETAWQLGRRVARELDVRTGAAHPG